MGRRLRALAVASLVFAACGELSSIARSPASPMPTPVATTADGAIPWSAALASPTPTPLPTPPLVACRPEDVRATFERWGVAAGSVGGQFRLAPAGDVCGILAYPRFRFVTADGAAFAPQDAVARGGALVPVVDPSGERSTYVDLEWSGHGGDPAYACGTRSASLVALEIAVGSRWLGLPFAQQPITLCADPLERVFLRVTAPDAPAVARPEPAFDARVRDVPADVWAGTRMRYLVQLTNRSAATQRFDECPAYVQSIAGPQELGSADRPGFRSIERRQILSCAALERMAPGTTLTFEMYFDVPPDLQPGTYVLPWRLDGPAYSTGTKETFRVLAR